MQESLKNLNNSQKEAVLYKEGPLLIVAGAGAGKTKTIVHRILHLIEEGIRPEQILAVTFTNKAAKEMRERITKSLAESPFSQVLGSPFGLNQTVQKRTLGSTPFISTFHSLGVQIIKENARLLGLNRHFTILDEQDSTSLIKESIKELSLDPKVYEPRKIRNIISREKGNFVHLENYLEHRNDYLGKVVGQVWALYEEKKKKENSLDFDDLLLKATRLLQEKKEIREMYQDRWPYIHIDEYQDTNEVQYRMAKLLAEKYKNICVVGDADQNIYSWRGANLKNILHFEKDYPKAKIILLEENYRSTQNILEAANEIIKKNKYRPEKNLFTKNKIGEKISFYEALDEGDEADFVATKILEILQTPSPFGHSPFAGGEDSRQDVLKKNIAQADGPRGSAPRARGDSDPAREEPAGLASLPDIAILYRTNFQSRVLEEAMLRYGIPYQVLGVKFFERKEIKDTLAYLRAALNPDSLSDIKRIINFPARGIGKATLIKIFAKDFEKIPIKTKIKINNFYEILEAIKEKILSEPPSEVIKFVLKKSGIENELKNSTEEDLERLENIKELATLALKYNDLLEGRGIEKLLEDAALASDQDSIMYNLENPKGKQASYGAGKKEKGNSVKLMTVHAAKGLEFKYVFIVGLEDGLFPHAETGNQKREDSEEERRLFYVALTRAKEKLFLSFANFRTIFGSRNINAPSEFINDIPNDLIEREGQEKIKTIYL